MSGGESMENQEKDTRLQQIEAVDEKLSQEVLEKYSLEENTRKTGGWYAEVIAAVALAMACFHVRDRHPGNDDAAFHPPLLCPDLGVSDVSRR